MRIATLSAKAIKRGLGELRILRWNINKKFRKSVTVSTEQGIFTVMLADNVISPCLYCWGEYELDLITKAMALLRSIQKCPPKGRGTILDVGANNGGISIGALHIGEVEKAISIEPSPREFSLLQRNVEQNGLRDRVICLPYAVSRQKGEVAFELSDVNFGDNRVRLAPASTDVKSSNGLERTITVQADQLDDLLSNVPELFTKTISVMWVDVQGHEGYVFMGARKLLATGIPVVSEFWPEGIKLSGMSQEQFCEIVQSLWSHYWVMRRGRFVRCPTKMFDMFFDEVGYGGDYDNVIFTQ